MLISIQMNIPLSPALAMTDQEIIERLAREVMGYTQPTYPKCRLCNGSGCESDTSSTCRSCKGGGRTGLGEYEDWNPLTKWDHTMEVVWKVDRPWGWHLNYLVKGTMTQNECRRAICIAALKAVDASDSQA